MDLKNAHASKTRKRAFDFIIALVVFINVYSQYLQRITGINSFAIIMLPMMLSMLLGTNNRSIIRLNKKLLLILLPLLIIPITQIIVFGYNQQMVKYSVYIVFYVMLVQSVDIDTWKIVKKTCYAISFFLIIDVLAKLPAIVTSNLRLYNVRRFTVVDKPTYSLFLTITVVLEIIDVFFDKKSNKPLALLYILLCTFINVYIFNSKSSILVFVLAMIVLICSVSRRNRLRIGIIMMCFATILVMATTITPNLVPEYIKATIDYLFSDKGYNVIYNRYNTSIIERQYIATFALSIIRRNPLYGIGFGNYINLAKECLPGYASQTESSLINCFVEGGILYGLSFVLLNAFIIMKFIDNRNILHYRKLYLELFSLIIMLVLFIIQNDYFSVTYWVFMSFTTCIVQNRSMFVETY